MSLLHQTSAQNDLKPGAGYQHGLQLADEPVRPFKSIPEISIGCCAAFLTGSVRPSATTWYPWTDVNNESEVSLLPFLYCGLSVIDMDLQISSQHSDHLRCLLPWLDCAKQNLWDLFIYLPSSHDSSSSVVYWWGTHSLVNISRMHLCTGLLFLCNYP